MRAVCVCGVCGVGVRVVWIVCLMCVCVWFGVCGVMFVFLCGVCECRVLSGRGLCDELITRPEESYHLCCVVVCDLETSRMGASYIYDISRLRVKHS